MKTGRIAISRLGRIGLLGVDRDDFPPSFFGPSCTLAHMSLGEYMEGQAEGFDIRDSDPEIDEDETPEPLRAPGTRTEVSSVLADETGPWGTDYDGLAMTLGEAAEMLGSYSERDVKPWARIWRRVPVVAETREEDYNPGADLDLGYKPLESTIPEESPCEAWDLGQFRAEMDRRDAESRPAAEGVAEDKVSHMQWLAARRFERFCAGLRYIAAGSVERVARLFRWPDGAFWRSQAKDRLREPGLRAWGRNHSVLLSFAARRRLGWHISQALADAAVKAADSLAKWPRKSCCGQPVELYQTYCPVCHRRVAGNQPRFSARFEDIGRPDWTLVDLEIQLHGGSDYAVRLNTWYRGGREGPTPLP